MADRAVDQPAAEHGQIEPWNSAMQADLDECCVQQLFVAQAAHTPDSIAVVCGDEQLSYAELNARANQLAHYLQAQGVEPEMRVGLCVERSLDLVVGLLGILKAGAAYVPLDPSYPAERLQFMLQDAQISILVTQHTLRATLPAHAAQQVCLDREWQQIAQQPAADLTIEAQPDHLAYVIYTSGSTGRPKGVEVTHRNLVDVLRGSRATFGFDSGTVMPWIASVAFDIALFELCNPLLAGGTSVVLRREEILDLSRLQEVLSGCTALHAVPSLLRQIVGQATTTHPQLRLLFVGGEAVPPDLLHVLPSVFPSAEVHVLYGPTEATIICTSYHVPRDTAIEGYPIGTPLPNQQLRIVDDHGRPVPVGVAGELYIGGAGVARGYLHRPDLTAEKFIVLDGQRWYRSGDRARCRPDGTIEFLGRLDHQIKLRGFRIELEEIEAVLRRHPGVREAVVIVREDLPPAGGHPDQRLVAYVVENNEQGNTIVGARRAVPGTTEPVGARPAVPGQGNKQPEEQQDLVAALRAHVAAMLPEYMVPSVIVRLDALPLTVNGKLDRRALPAPDTVRAAVDTPFVPPGTPTEEQVAKIWADLLRLDRIGIHDNFLALGSHSLLATQALSRLRDAFGIELPISALFDAPTVADLAQRIEESRALPDGAPLQPVAGDVELPLSFAQQRLWFFDQWMPNSPAYNVLVAFRLRGPLAIDALHQSLQTIIRRHAALRTTFADNDGQPAQIIARELVLPLPLVDLSDLSADERGEKVERLIAAQAHQPFDLQHGPLLRAQLLQLADDEHLFLLTIHHIVYDAWSEGVLLHELSVLYTAFVTDRAQPEESVLPPLAIQYADFAVWQRQWLAGAVLEQQLSYWQQQLADLPVLDLPTDRPRPPKFSFNGTQQHFQLPAPLSAALHTLSHREGVTLFMTLLAAFETLLHRYSGQTDFAVGSPIAGRNRRDIEPLIGFFVNTLILRADLAGNPSFHELLQRVRGTTLSAYAHQDLPFEQIVDALQPARDLSRTPLFQVLFTLQNAPATTPELPGVQVTPLDVPINQSRFDLTISLRDTPDGLSAQVEYNTDLFEAATIQRLMAHYQSLLTAVTNDPQQRIDRLPLLTEHERHMLLHAWNDTAYPYLIVGGIHQLVEAQAARTPDAVALVVGDHTLSYGDLNARANQLAHALRAQGVAPEVRVAVALEPTVALIASLLGIWKAGGVYVPLDPAYPTERLRWLLADSRPALLLSEQRFLAHLPADELPVLCLDRDWTEIAHHPATNPMPTTGPDDLAYMIYTSGSTGQPKGVLAAHRGLLNNLQWRQHTWPLSANDRVLLNYAMSFDPALWNICWPLSAGAQLVLISQEQRYDSAALVRTMAEQRITVFGASPSQHAMLLKEPGISACASLRYVVSGGEQLSSEVQQQFHAALDAILCNCYGPTETTIDTTFWISEPNSASQAAPIGRPLPNTEVYLLDRQGQPVPVGVPGEVYIGGVGLARGYHQRPEVTAERFVPHPFSTVAGSRLYRTGDLARFRADGRIEYLGRTDHQVKLRGFRIELGELEALLRQHSQVREAVVIVRQDQPPAGGHPDQRLVAYVVPNTEQQNRVPCPEGTRRTTEQDDTGTAGRAQTEDSLLDAAELRHFLQERVPSYMVPSAFMVLDALPLTPNGKLDRAALPALDEQHAAPEETFVAPRTPLETLVAEAWAEVLGRNRIGIHDNFFALGGHSLIATQVVARIRHRTGRDIQLRLLFAAPTVATFAERLAEHDQQAAAIQTIPVVPRDGRPLPLSFAQQRLWIAEQLHPGSNLYSVPLALRLHGPLDSAALQRSLSTIVERHEVLRASYRTDPALSTPYQSIAPSGELPLPVELLAAADEATLRQAVQVALAQPFALQTGPLLRASLFRAALDTHLLVLMIHHSVFDGWSQSILLRELATLYAAHVQHRPLDLPPLPIQYADYAVWQREWMKGAVLEQLLAYWQQQLAQLPPLELPTDHPRPPARSYSGAYITFEMPALLITELNQLSQQLDSTLFMVMLAAWQTLLARYSGQTDLAVGTPIAGRTRPELEPLIGFFINTLVLRTDLGGGPSFAELVARVRAVCLDAYAHQDMPFELLVEHLQPERDLSRTPLFQVLFVFQNTPHTALALPDLKVAPLDVSRSTAQFDLTLTLTETAQGFQGSIEYSTDLFEATTIGRLAGHYQTLLAALVADPQQRIDRVPLLTEQERHQLLVEWNADTLALPPVGGIHQLVEAQAARTPDAVALVFGDYTLSYGDLNARANQLAHALRAQGVAPEVRVAVALEPTVALIASLLGIWKAGGVYVPLDPAYPTERLRWLLADSRPALLLSEQRFLAHLPADDLPVLCLDRNWTEIAHHPATNPMPTTGPDDLAHMIYTSGSTGQPKGVLAAHRGLLNNLQWRQHTWPLSANDRVLLNFAMSFDPSLWNICWPLSAGAQLVLISQEQRYDSAALVRTMAEQRVTIFGATPSHLAVLLKEPAISACASLRYVVSGGEQLSSEVQQQFHAALDAILCNCYGPTETTIDTTFWISEPNSASQAAPIGRPLPNTEVYLLDRQGQPVPVGVPGEVYIGGVGLARGYHQRPEVTAERFVPHPFAQGAPAIAGLRLYRTGDLARFRADGRIEYLGRTDHQVKVRGYRIELGEIETVLMQHPQVRQAAVLARHEAGDVRLVAYVVGEQGNKEQANKNVGARLAVPGATEKGVDGLGRSELRAFLKTRLPEYMVPSAFVVLESLPRTANGKLDQRALPVPDLTHQEPEAEYVAPRTPLEEILAGFWTDVFPATRIGVHDNFFDLGGHSLLATQIASRINQAFHAPFPVNRLFEAPTIAALASRMIETEPKPGQTEKIAQILKRIKDMSPEDRRKTLQQKKEQ